ncbi:phosphoribosylglycinamide formyltransferase [Fictibacillus aquaticus]|uniref:Phosphoribosylglycinamide formyltransferase n=1 Tax=Fictibacillus aquaticus TaxID=2021314 RepID=A0A235F687_9BACL|nr:phosphoribosylglycinamide formyltransferase [Fictibacillus aquaticus]OYD56790.1 phosphoribosylglycinamide formyltransferase [Fictibacillus aquaticus]
MNIAVFASGSGSNFQALLDAEASGKLSAAIKLLVCDKPNAFAVERANKAGIPVYSFNAKDFSSKEEYEREILVELQKHSIDFIALAGYMRLVGTVLLDAFEGRMVNIHPSLLPHFPGKDAVGQALAAGVQETGVTLHYVDSGMDTGPIIEQAVVAVLPGDTADTLQARIQKTEHELYPRVLQNIIHKQMAGGITK